MVNRCLQRPAEPAVEVPQRGKIMGTKSYQVRQGCGCVRGVEYSSRANGANPDCSVSTDRMSEALPGGRVPLSPWRLGGRAGINQSTRTYLRCLREPLCAPVFGSSSHCS